MPDENRRLDRKFCVGRWTIDSDTLSASDGKTTNALEPRGLQVLRTLAERKGQVVSIDELMDQHWAGTVVTPNAVTRVIAHLRKALGDNAKEPKYIQTVSRNGYRLVAKVSSAAPQRRRHHKLIAAAVILLLAATIAWFSREATLERPAIAVLPFENLSGDTSLDYIGDGLSEEVINSLAQFANIDVVSRTSTFLFRGSESDAAEIGTSLGATHLVEGSVRKQHDTLRVTAQLIDAVTGYHEWSKTYERPANDVFAIQDEIAATLARVVMARMDGIPGEPAIGEAVLTNTASPAAYDLYMRGRHLWHQRGRNAINRAIEHFHEAVVIDPEYARAWAALAAAYNTLPAYDRSVDAGMSVARALEAANRALELDDSLGEAHAVIAAIEQTRGNWSEAEARYRRAIETTPDRSTPLYWHAEMLTMVGRVSDALALIDEASVLNPLYPPVYIDKGFNSMDLGHYEQGMLSFRRGADLGEMNIQIWLGQLVGLLHAEDWEGADAWLEQRPFKSGIEVDRAYIDARRNPTPDNIERATIAALDAYRARRTDPKLVIHILAQLDQFDLAIEVARELYAKGFNDWRSLWGPGYSDFRQRPEFRDLVAELGLVDYWQSHEWGDFCVPTEGGFECR